MPHDKEIENRTSFTNRLNKAGLTDNEVKSVMRAYRLAKSAHRTINRDDGTRYFEHCRAGCLILMDELNLYDPDLLASFLLHDSGEDTALLGNILESYHQFLEDASFILVKTFGLRVYENVVRLTKPAVDNKTFFDKKQVYNHYITSLIQSEEAILLKMVDRLHNLRSLLGNNPEKIARQIKETEEVYLPIFKSVSGDFEPYAKTLIAKIEEQLEMLKANQ